MKVNREQKELIRACVATRKITYATIAPQMNITPEYLSRLVNGRTSLTEHRASQLYGLLGSPSELDFLVDTTLELLPKEKAWERLYETYTAELLQTLLISSLDTRGKILADLEGIVAKYRKK